MFWCFGGKACGIEPVPLVNFYGFFFFLRFSLFNGQWVMNKAHCKLALVDKGFLLFLLLKNFFQVPEGPGCWDARVSALLVRREPAHWGSGTRPDPYQRTLAQGTFSVP